MKDNCKTVNDDKQLSQDEYYMIKQAAQLLRPDVALPCTGCRYCVPDCPVKLNIPQLLVSYNDAEADSPWRLVNLIGLPESKRPAACIQCGSCTAHCPQSLDIPSAMAEMAHLMAQFEE